MCGHGGPYAVHMNGFYCYGRCFFYFLSLLTRGVESIILTVLPRRLIDVTRSSSVPTSLAVALTARRLMSSQFEDVDSGGPIGPNEQWGRDPPPWEILSLMIHRVLVGF